MAGIKKTLALKTAEYTQHNVGMDIKTVNDKRFVRTDVISKQNTYRFDLSPMAVAATAIAYDFSTGWEFRLEDGSNATVTYSASEIRAKLEAGTIWKQLK